MKIKIFVFIFFITAFLGCHSLYQKYQPLETMDGSVQYPNTTFIYENSLYFLYEHGDEKFILAAPLPETVSREYSRESILDAKVIDNFPKIDESKKEYVVLANDVLNTAINNIIDIIAPSEKNAGVMLITSARDVVLYRDENGNIKISEVGSIPKKISIVNKIDRYFLRKLSYEEIIKTLKMEYPAATKFVLPLDYIPLVPYIYIDTEREIAAAVKLPDYYQVQKNISALGFSYDAIYSIFIKSHLFAIIKSPFTSIHRLFSTATYTVFASFSPEIENIKGEIPRINEEAEMMDLKEFEKSLDSLISQEKYKGKIQILIDGNTFFPDFIEKATNAKHSIDIRMYIFKADPYALTLADLIKKKSNEDIRVRVLLDEMNTFLNWTKDPQMYSQGYVMPNIKTYLKENSKVKLRTRLNTWFNVDHIKVIVIDEKYAYAGGMNFGEEYRYFWHDLMLLLEGPIVLKLSDDFKQTWTFSGAGGDYSAAFRRVFTQTPDYYKNITDDMYDIRVLYTKPTSAEIYDAQILAIQSAKKRIYIQNPYFSDTRVIQELINARGRGVDVRVIIPVDNDSGIMARNNLVKANILFRNGIRVYFYPRMTHVKAAIYDNWACLGSCNFDKLSLYVNQEMDLAVSNPEFVEDLNNKLFQKDFAESELMTEELELSPADRIISIIAAQA